MLHTSKYQQIKVDKDLDAISNYWTIETEDMSNEEFQAENLKWLECYESFKPKNIIADTREYKYMITPEMQDWHAEYVFSKLMNFKPHKMAMIVSADIFSQVSIEQTIQEGEDITDTEFQTKYFESEEDAKKWLKK